MNPTPPPRVVVLGDLVVDVVLAPARALERSTDVPGRVLLRQGGSAANTARGLGRLGARTTFICAVGRDPAGRALVAALERDGVRTRAVRVAAVRTGRIGVLNSSERLPPSAAFVLAMRLILPVHILPEGMTKEALLTAEMASSGEIRYC